MTIWSPSPDIKVKVLGLAWRGDQLLLSEVTDSAGRVKGVRPLGGSIEFGETREQALRREFDEELGCAIKLVGSWHSFENIFEHEGSTGHEFIFAANIELDNRELYTEDRIVFVEANLTSCRAGWFTPKSLPSGIDLYPNGLLPLIETGAITATA